MQASLALSSGHLETHDRFTRGDKLVLMSNIILNTIYNLSTYKTNKNLQLKS